MKQLINKSMMFKIKGYLNDAVYGTLDDPIATE